ncbi:TPA: hypothetical protein PXM26_003992 [Yersinia enterocolitica]|nr:hypothetical protein [Yersinia enterocolitica]
MFNREEVKEFIVKFGKRCLFPDVSNQISKYVIFTGIVIVAGINPYSVIIINWIIDVVNQGKTFGVLIPHLSDDRVDYIFGVMLVSIAMIHNIFYQWIKFCENKIKEEQIHDHAMASAALNEQKSIKDREIEQRKNKEKIIVDRALFKKFLDVFPSDSMSIELLKNHDFENSYHIKSTKQIESFVDTWNTAETSFLNKEIESKRKILWSECNLFVNTLSIGSYTIMGGPMLRVVPDAYVGAWDYPKEVQDKIDNLNKSSTRCFELHQELILLCRRELNQ